MMLQTEHDREFYLAKAEEHPLLKDAVEGSASFHGRLDDLVRMVTGREGAPPRTEHPKDDFKAYLTVLEDISSAGLDVEALSDSGLDMALYDSGRIVSDFFIGVGTVGAIMLVFPPLAAIEGVALCVGGGLGWFFGKATKEYKELRERADEIFAPAYKAAKVVDACIGKCFILEHFADARPRFEQTYAGLPADERHIVDAQLYRLLGAGGIPGMDEAELDRYLDGLRQQEAGHEGTILRRDVRYHDVHGLCAVEFDMTPEEFQEEKAAHIKAKGLRGRAPSEYMSIELEDLLCGFPDRLRIVKVFGRGKEAEKQGDAYIEELREWHRNRDNEYLRELADILW